MTKVFFPIINCSKRSLTAIALACSMISHAAMASDEAKPEPEAAKAAEAPAPPPVNEYQITNSYSHKWLPFPPASGKSIDSGEPLRFEPKTGEASIYVFLASWCIPCQKLAPRLKELSAKYGRRFSRFVFVFAHDTAKDAQGFAKTYNLSGNLMVASQEMLKTFHEPELPAVYMGDRTGWLVWRSLKTTMDDVAALDKFLESHTGF